MNTDRGPGIPFPPPLVFLAGYALALWLDSRLEFQIAGAGAGTSQEIAGLVLVVAGFGLMAWGILTFVRARTAVMPNKAARTVVTNGPYRFTRNPMYLGLTLAYAGSAVGLNQAWPFVVLPLVLAVVQFGLIRREERHLRAAFGDAYAAYTRRVRRWI